MAASVSTATMRDSAVSGATDAGTRHFSVSTVQPQNSAATAASTQSSSIGQTPSYGMMVEASRTPPPYKCAGM